MSCTENESGPFVVFFLPAVIGCLTILLIRRWANSQVSSTTSTAVSRRRKIIKDPLVKRPLPTLPVKMVAPSKKSGVIKKCAVNASDEDPNGVVKRVGRSIRSASTTANSPPNVTSDKQPDLPPLPKHIPFPYIPQDGELLFESMTFVFGVVAMGLQFLNLYRTTWWLPNSNTNQPMKFYLIDPHLVAFIVTVLFRRLLLSMNVAVMRYLMHSKFEPTHRFVATRTFILGVVLGVLGWSAYFIAYKHTTLKLFYLCYPVVIYYILFGLESGPFLELHNSPIPLLHNCSQDVAAIRAEVEMFREDFNLKLKKIIFNALVDAYYTSFVPCCFVQPYVYYSVSGAAQQLGVVLGGAAGRYAAHALSAAHCDPPHRAARHRIYNTPVDNDSDDIDEASTGSQVRRGEGAARDDVSALLMDKGHERFYKVFSDPSNLQCIFLCMQLSLIIIQIILLFSSIQWHHFLALVILLFINYYTLFKMLRDYLISWKVYKAEAMIQDKNGTVPQTAN